MAFSFENYERNQNLINAGLPVPKARKTGTTICAIIYKDGVILGADTRSTMGSFVSEKDADKIHYIADHIRCCGAGTAADTDKVTRMFSSQLELHRLLTGKKVPIIAAIKLIQKHLFQHQGYIGAALILGGVDENGPRISSIHPHGSVDTTPYTAMGSGCLAALAILERDWKPELELEDAKKLVRNAIAAGIMHDLGSGNSIDMCIITKDKTDYIKSYEHCQTKPSNLNSYKFKPKSVTLVSRTVIPIKNENTTVRQLEEPMEVL